MVWAGQRKVDLEDYKISKNKYDDKYNSSTKCSLDRQRRYFLEFTQTHTWHPSITEEVREKFNKVCFGRFKGITTRKQPIWITETLYKILRKEWNTKNARK